MDGDTIVIRRPVAFVAGMVAAGVLAGALAAWMITLPHATGPALDWGLASNVASVDLPRDTTVVRIRTDPWPGCHPYDQMIGDSANGSWLVADVSYSWESVTITLHQSSSFDASKCPGWFDYFGLPMEIHLREPLNGRVLLDGSE
jgi:hypothetical protein